MRREAAPATNGWTPLQALAEDVLFFRDGRPSTQGSDHYLRSLFPPHPSTVYGALRTRRLLDAAVPLDRLAAETWEGLLGPLVEELGPWGGFGSLALRGPWLVRSSAGREEVLLPAPADLEVLTRESGRAAERYAGPPPRQVTRVFRLLPVEPGGARWSHPLALLAPHERTGDGWRLWEAPPADEPRSATGWLLSASGFRAWREGGVPAPEDFVAPSELWLDEVRVGIGLSAADRTAEDRMLYTFGNIRLLQGVGIGFEVQGTGLVAEGHVRLGGDGRTARLAAGPELPLAPSPDLGGASRFRVVLGTPTLSTAGGYPPGFGADALAGALEPPCRLVAAAVPEFRLAGGWDVAKKWSKPLRRLLPAGSVFVFASLEPGAAAVAAARLDGAPLADFPGAELGRQGFGLALVGAEPQGG